MKRGNREVGWLALWDVDGTTVSTLPDVERIYCEAIARVLGPSALELNIHTHGKTDTGIILSSVRELGFDERTAELALSPILFELEGILKERFDWYLSKCHMLPGVLEALKMFHDSGACNSVVSGNTRRNAHAKLAGFGIHEEFDLAVGGYGDESADRARLVSIAVERAKVIYNKQIPRDRVVVIGDTPLDASAARRAGTRVVLVATGLYSTSELRLCTPDLIIEDLKVGKSSLELIIPPKPV